MGTALDELDELIAVYPGAQEMREAGVRYVFIPGLVLPSGQKVDALLRPDQVTSDGYITRLFLSQPVDGKGQNWQQFRILDRSWHTWSWNNVSPSGRLAQIIAGHLRALR